MGVAALGVLHDEGVVVVEGRPAPVLARVGRAADGARPVAVVAEEPRAHGQEHVLEEGGERAAHADVVQDEAVLVHAVRVPAREAAPPVVVDLADERVAEVVREGREGHDAGGFHPAERVDAREVANVLRVVLVVGRHDVTRVARDAP